MKKVKIICLLVCILFGSELLNSQTDYFQHYSPLLSKGPIPADFFLSTKEMIEKDRAQMNQNMARGDRKQEVFFHHETNYYFDLIRRSGGLLLNDTIGNYLNAIADKLLGEDSKTRKNISVYVLKSSEVNAFSSDRGMICLNMGLIARTSCEAELAFVLAHEIVHFQRKHAISTFMKVNRKSRKNEEYEKNLTKYHLYSRLSEIEADSIGLKMIINAGYDPIAAVGVLDMLSHSAYSDLQRPVSPTVFESDHFIISDIYKTTQIKPVLADEADNADATHPGIAIRKERLSSAILQQGAGKLFQVESEDQFLFYRKIAVFEVARLLNNDGRFQDAIYHCLSLLQTDSGNIYLQKELARALYGFTLIRSRNENHSDEMQGEEQPLHFLFWQQTAVATNSMIFTYVWKLHREHPDDKDFVYYAYGILCEISLHNNQKLAEYYRSDLIMKKRADEVRKSDTSSVTAKKSDVELYRDWLNKHVKEKEGQNYYRFALHDFFSDSSYYWLFQSATVFANGDIDFHRSTIERIAGSKSPEGMIVAVPFAVSAKIGRRNEEAIDFLKMEKMRNDMTDAIEGSAEPLGLNIVMADPLTKKDSAILYYNGYARVNEWASMYELVDDSTSPLIPFHLSDINQIESQFNASSVFYTGFIHTSEPIFREPFYWPMLLYFPAIPMSAWIIFKPVYENYLFAGTFDMRTGQCLYSQVDVMERQPYHRGLITVHLFQILKNSPNTKKQ